MSMYTHFSRAVLFSWMVCADWRTYSVASYLHNDERIKYEHFGVATKANPNIFFTVMIISKQSWRFAVT